MNEGRRGFLRFLGKASVLAAFLVQIAAAARAFVPNVLYEPSRRFKVRRPKDYPQGVTFDPDHRLFLIREQDAIYALSAVCTHLGCTVQWKQDRSEFACPCHGSKFQEDGTVVGGPAPRPLACYALSISPDGYLEVDTADEVAFGSRLTLPKESA
ncbi:MAG TPA: Rieske 2Fe-2S domain-containing protein [Candidatus Binatia bacterium]|jgi:cytochrome b6-f complex iron-sulfur subunit